MSGGTIGTHALSRQLYSRTDYKHCVQASRPALVLLTGPELNDGHDVSCPWVFLILEIMHSRAQATRSTAIIYADDIPLLTHAETVRDNRCWSKAVLAVVVVVSFEPKGEHATESDTSRYSAEATLVKIPTWKEALQPNTHLDTIHSTFHFEKTDSEAVIYGWIWVRSQGGKPWNVFQNNMSPHHRVYKLSDY